MNRAQRRLLKSKKKLDPVMHAALEDEMREWTIETQRAEENEAFEMLDEFDDATRKFFLKLQEYRSKGFDTPPEEWACPPTPEEIAIIRKGTTLKFYPVGAITTERGEPDGGHQDE